MADERRRGRSPAELLERAQQLRLKIQEQDVYDLQAFKQLLDDVRGAAMSDEISLVYEELVAAFPTAVGIWTRYVEAEMAAGNAEGVKAVFGRCLMQCPSVDLWFMYLKFIKKSNEPRGAEGILETRQAYDFTLDTIGQDIHSGPLWQEYIGFLSGPKPGSAAYGALWSSGMVGGQEESSKVAALRRTYQRAIVVPTHSLELIWKNYEAFEQQTAAAAAAGGGGSGLAAKQFSQRVVGEQRPRFQAARMAYRERKRKMEGIDPAALPVPPGKGGPSQQEQARLWKAFLEYERSNPQRLEAGALAQRVELGYMQALMCLLHFPEALMCLLHFPEVWYDYARWHADAGSGVAQATACLVRAVAALPNCLLLHFALADLQEAQGHTDAAREVYESLVKQLEPPPGAAQQQQQQQPNGADPAAPPAPPEPAGGPIAALPPDQHALAWIQYMRFCRRESLLASRKMFIRAKKAPRCPWQVYVASALMEWRHVRERDVARKIFEKGLEVAEYATTPEYILAYADFLCDVGDVDNARALFERVLTEDANRKSVLLWERYLAFEFEMGDLQSALRLEKRAREALGELSGAPGAGAARNIQLLLLRYQFLDSYACPPGQQQYLLHLMGKGPAPPGFERQRRGGAAGSEGGDGAGQDDRNAGRGGDGWSPAVPGERDMRGGTGPPSALPPLLDRFLSMLPAPEYLDGPVPDLNLVLDTLLGMPDDEHGGVAGGGVKRELEGDEHDMGGGPGRDIFRMRAKQRARLAAGDA
ncbi:hypothetical protein OEZ86_008179 [Tetradesmus obliquus]|nr:hypothetical protein OEZ86_008179 [Tetradesmus obliquus]